MEGVGALEPVVCSEALGAESVPAVATAEARDAVRRSSTREVAVADPVPAVTGTVETAIASRAVRGHERGGFVRHALESLQAPCRQQSLPHRKRRTRADQPPGRRVDEPTIACAAHFGPPAAGPWWGPAAVLPHHERYEAGDPGVARPVRPGIVSRVRKSAAMGRLRSHARAPVRPLVFPKGSP